MGGSGWHDLGLLQRPDIRVGLYACGFPRDEPGAPAVGMHAQHRGGGGPAAK
jgi:hypothetical protein